MRIRSAAATEAATRIEGVFLSEITLLIDDWTAVPDEGWGRRAQVRRRCGSKELTACLSPPRVSRVPAPVIRSGRLPRGSLALLVSFVVIALLLGTR